MNNKVYLINQLKTIEGGCCTRCLPKGDHITKKVYLIKPMAWLAIHFAVFLNCWVWMCCGCCSFCLFGVQVIPEIKIRAHFEHIIISQIYMMAAPLYFWMQTISLKNKFLCNCTLLTALTNKTNKLKLICRKRLD